MQMFVLVGGSIILTVFGLNELGGVGELMENTTANHWSLWRPLSDTNYPWTGIMFGALILGIWYWCTDQFIVQRSRGERHRHRTQRRFVRRVHETLAHVHFYDARGSSLATRKIQNSSFADGGYDAALPLMKTVLPQD